MARRKVARSTPKKCGTTRRRTCARTRREKPKKESKLKKLGKFALGAGALAGAGALGYYGYKNRDKIGDLYNIGKNEVSDLFNTAKVKSQHIKDDVYNYMKSKAGDLTHLDTDVMEFNPEVSKYKVPGQSKFGQYYNYAKQLLGTYMDKFADMLGPGNFNRTTDLVEVNDVNRMLHMYKDRLKTSNEKDAFNPFDYLYMMGQYLDNIQERNPFKLPEIGPLFKEGIDYIGKGLKSMQKGEVFFTETYKKGLEQTLDSLIGKYQLYMH